MDIPTTFTMYAAIASRQLKPRAGKKAITIGGIILVSIEVIDYIGGIVLRRIGGIESATTRCLGFGVLC